MAYKSVVTTGMIYGAHSWEPTKAHCKAMDVTEMKMSRKICDVTRADRVRNERMRGTVKVTELSEKVQERRLHWYDYVMKRDDIYVGKRITAMAVKAEEIQEEDGGTVFMKISGRNI